MRDIDRSRRGFLKASVIAGLTVMVEPLGSRAFAALFEEKILRPLQWDAASGGAKLRIDGIAKVTGAKVFARDVRAPDMPHWPKQQSHAFILRTTQADRVYAGFDLTLLGDELQPDRIVTAADLSGRRILHLLGLPPVDGTAPTCRHSLRRESVARVLRLARCIRWWY
ncbi:MAG: aldehyde oxidase [Caballeronia mineralivorans]|jgi:hypothetical protein|nr:aldehyde oxidase [Caballeronia mineralivorans]MEA3104995.1 hypothetical protein [Caballeronia mineralivorans]